MQKSFFLVTVLASTLTLAAAPVALAQNDPAEVLEKSFEAFNRGDAAGALAMFADNAVFDAPGGLCVAAPCVGKAAILKELEREVADKPHVTILKQYVSGNVVTSRVEFRSDTVKKAGVERIIGWVITELKGDKIAYTRGGIPDRSDPQTTRFVGTFELAPTLGTAPTARIELHPFQTMTLTDKQFLTGAKDGTPVVMAGELRLPRLGTDRLPAVVLVHGSGGVGANVDRWSQELHGIGVATFILDSFTARGIVNTTTNQAQLGGLAMLIDAYRALEVLAKHPRIDPARIGIMGFSRGGRVALYASLKRFQRLHGPADVEFAAYLPFYAPCNTTYIDDGEVSDRPIRLFHGAADDYVPVAPCRAYVERLRQRGKDVELTEYPDAHHGFDSPLLRAPVFLPQAQTGRRCTLEEKPVGQLINHQTAQPYSLNDPCIERGATVAYNTQAHSEALKAVKDFLTRAFNLK
jgi:dienelactone hydrolase/ketosteroid isomerase-like protein